MRRICRRRAAASKKNSGDYTAAHAALGGRTLKTGQSRWFVGYKKHTLRLWLPTRHPSVTLVPLVSWLTPHRAQSDQPARGSQQSQVGKPQFQCRRPVLLDRQDLLLGGGPQQFRLSALSYVPAWNSGYLAGFHGQHQQPANHECALYGVSSFAGSEALGEGNAGRGGATGQPSNQRLPYHGPAVPALREALDRVDAARSEGWGGFGRSDGSFESSLSEHWNVQ